MKTITHDSSGNEITKASFVPFDTFPLENQEVPEGYNGWLLFLDEMTSATKAVQAPTYKLLLDRAVGGHKLHQKVIIAAAGNKATDNAITNPLSTALKSRVVTYEIQANPDEWLEWAQRKNIDQRIRAFIAFSKHSLMDFDPDRDDHTFPCPRTWEYLSRLIKNTDVSPKLVPRIAGTIGKAKAAEFITYAAEFHNLPSMNDIINDPKNTIIPVRASTRYALSTVVADYVAEAEEEKKESIAKVLTYMERFEPEFQVIFCRTALNRNPKLRRNPAMVEYAMKYIKEY